MEPPSLESVSAAQSRSSQNFCSKSIVPIVMAGILGIYGLIIAVLFNGDIKKTEFDQLVKLGTDPKGGNYSAYKGFQQLGAGLCCGMSSLAAGLAIGVVGDTAVRANA